MRPPNSTVRLAAELIKTNSAAIPEPSVRKLFGAALDQTFQDESVQGHNFVVKRSRRVDDLKTCHLVFISRSEKDQIAQVLTSLSAAGVVTVSEMDRFAERGGIINFYLENKKVRFEINADAAQRKGLKINSQLLKRAKIVGSNS